MARMSHTKINVGKNEPKTPVGASRLGGDDLQILSLKVDGVFRGVRQIAGASLLGGVLAGAFAGAAPIALGALVLGAEEAGLIAGAAIGAAALILIKHHH
jgi:hypothetical protein